MDTIFSRLRARLIKGLRLLKNAFRRFTAVFRTKRAGNNNVTKSSAQSPKISESKEESKNNPLSSAKASTNVLADPARDEVLENCERPAQNIQTKSATTEEQTSSKLMKGTAAALVRTDGQKRKSVAALITEFDKNDSESAADKDATTADPPGLKMRKAPAGLLSSGTSKKFAPNFLVRFFSNLSSSSEVSDKAVNKAERP